jgi:hypothetical protein
MIGLIPPMSLIHGGKLSTSFAYSKVEAVADFGVDALVRTHSPGFRLSFPNVEQRQHHGSSDTSSH